MNASGWERYPNYRIVITPCEHPMRVVFHGVVLAQSRHALQLEEQGLAPVYYFPRNDVNMTLLEATKKVSHCPFKGDAFHWALNLEDRYIEIAAWSYEKPFDQVAVIKDHIAFYPEVIDALIEDE